MTTGALVINSKKIIKLYKKDGYTMDIMRQSECLVVKVGKVAKIMNPYNQVTHLSRKVTKT